MKTVRVSNSRGSRPGRPHLIDLGLLLLFCLPALSSGAELGTLRQPDIHGDRIVFVQGSELWTCPARGGRAERLTWMPGVKRFPKFSPDGRLIAYSAVVAGNEDVYIVPSRRGESRRLTWHPGADLVVGWHPDGQRVLFRSSRSGFNDRFNRLFLVPLEGGLARPLALPEGEQAGYDAGGGRIVFCRESSESLFWKGYRGGLLTGLWRYDFRTGRADHIVANATKDQHPMWRRS